MSPFQKIHGPAFGTAVIFYHFMWRLERRTTFSETEKGKELSCLKSGTPQGDVGLENRGLEMTA